jgi:hypothetical protein
MTVKDVVPVKSEQFPKPIATKPVTENNDSSANITLSATVKKYQVCFM